MLAAAPELLPASHQVFQRLGFSYHWVLYRNTTSNPARYYARYPANLSTILQTKINLCLGTVCFLPLLSAAWQAEKICWWDGWVGPCVEKALAKQMSDSAGCTCTMSIGSASHEAAWDPWLSMRWSTSNEGGTRQRTTNCWVAGWMTKIGKGKISSKFLCLHRWHAVQNNKGDSVILCSFKSVKTGWQRLPVPVSPAQKPPWRDPAPPPAGTVQALQQDLHLQGESDWSHGQDERWELVRSSAHTWSGFVNKALHAPPAPTTQSHKTCSGDHVPHLSPTVPSSHVPQSEDHLLSWNQPNPLAHRFHSTFRFPEPRLAKRDESVGASMTLG